MLGRTPANAASAALPHPDALPHALPLGLRIGGRIQFDRTLYSIAPGAMTEELPAGYQGVPCYGHVNLGDGYALHRFYLDDDAFLQVSTVGDDVDVIKGFIFHETVNPPTKDAFRKFVMESDHLGAASIEYAGHRWWRVSNSTAGDERIPAMVYDEVLYRHEPARRDDDLTHYAMLYSRDVPELSREEFLLVSAEDSGPNEFSITYSVGMDLTTADIDIT
ncbi:MULTISPECIES: DUF2491 family protein [unclassified Pseudoxanthomonas]|uniref:DUF2491 family protein n=1 Tax=unclassified Pseudoxanthomonas TaxID=2645906 RepID=UPI0030776B94